MCSESLYSALEKQSYRLLLQTLTATIVRAMQDGYKVRTEENHRAYTSWIDESVAHQQSCILERKSVFKANIAGYAERKAR